MYIVYKLYAKSDLAKTPKYIGITATSLQLRLKRHLERANCKTAPNWPIVNWIKTISSNQDSVIIEPIDFAQTQTEAWEKEIFYISKYKSQGLFLKNATLGGEGNRLTPVQQFTKDGQLIKTWSTISNVEKELGISNSHISACCKGVRGRRTVGGFVWRYEGDTFEKFGGAVRKKNLYAKGIQKKVYQINKNGEIVKVWDHAQDIENQLGFLRSNICHACRKPITKQKNVSSVGGFHWCYEIDKDIVRSLLKSKNTVQVNS